MALDFHRLDTEEYWFGLDDEQYTRLSNLFEIFQQWTGLQIDAYKDMRLTTENCRTLIQIIDRYIQKTDLNINRKKTTAILGFRGLLNFFQEKNIEFKLKGD